MSKSSLATVVVRASVCGVALFALWCCGSGDGGGGPPKKIPCGTVTDCINYPDAGRCADRAKAKCIDSAAAAATSLVPPSPSARSVPEAPVRKERPTVTPASTSGKLIVPKASAQAVDEPPPPAENPLPESLEGRSPLIERLIEKRR